jgi:hypothetical protein
VVVVVVEGRSAVGVRGDDDSDSASDSRPSRPLRPYVCSGNDVNALRHLVTAQQELADPMRHTARKHLFELTHAEEVWGAWGQGGGSWLESLGERVTR